MSMLMLYLNLKIAEDSKNYLNQTELQTQLASSGMNHTSYFCLECLDIISL